MRKHLPANSQFAAEIAKLVWANRVRNADCLFEGYCYQMKKKTRILAQQNTARCQGSLYLNDWHLENLRDDHPRR